MKAPCLYQYLNHKPLPLKHVSQISYLAVDLRSRIDLVWFPTSKFRHVDGNYVMGSHLSALQTSPQISTHECGRRIKASSSRNAVYNQVGVLGGLKRAICHSGVYPDTLINRVHVCPLTKYSVHVDLNSRSALLSTSF